MEGMKQVGTGRDGAGARAGALEGIACLSAWPESGICSLGLFLGASTFAAFPVRDESA